MAKALSSMACELEPHPNVELSLEEHTLPKVVNMVCTVDLLSGMDDIEEMKRRGYGLNLYRIAYQYPGNTKYMKKRFAAITLRLSEPMGSIGQVSVDDSSTLGSTALLFQSGKIVLVSALSKNHAMFCSQQYRQWLEKVDFLMWDPKNKKSYIGNLRGKLMCRRAKIHNVVASGSLFQKGVDLSGVLRENQDKCDWVPDSFPNATYGPALLSDGKTQYKANISDSAKVVLMGVRNKQQIYEAYKDVKNLVSFHEDPDAPTDPGECYFYRMNKLLQLDLLIPQVRGRRSRSRKKKRKIVSATKNNNNKKQPGSRSIILLPSDDDDDDDAEDAMEIQALTMLSGYASISKKGKEISKKRKRSKRNQTTSVPINQTCEAGGDMMDMIMDALDYMAEDQGGKGLNSSTPNNNNIKPVEVLESGPGSKTGRIEGEGEKKKDGKNTLLMQAALKKQVMNVKLLITMGEDVNAINEDRKTAYDLIKDSDDPYHKAIAIILKQK